MYATKNSFELDSIEMKVIRVFLIAFILLLGFQALQFFNTRVIDKKHAELLVAKNQSVQAIQNLLIQSSTIQRKLLNLALTNDTTEKKQLEEIIAKASEDNNKALEVLENSSGFINPGSNKSLSEVKAASAEYASTFRVYQEKLQSGNYEAAMIFKNENLRPAFESYQEKQHLVLLAITNDLVRESNKVSRYTVTSGWILFFLGLAPFIYAIGKLVYLSILLKFKASRISMIDEEPQSRP